MLSMIMCKPILVKFCPSILKILNINEILTSIKDHYSVANVSLFSLTLLSRLLHSYRDEPIGRWGEMGKNVLYNPNLDVINVNVYTKFG